MNIAIITARGGSKRLPRKNILPFCGHPLIAWSMKQAQACKLIDVVIVTTDDQEIFWIADKYADEKTHIILRPVWDDDTASNKAFHHAVEHVEKMGLKGIDKIVAMFPTSPCRKLGDLDNTINRTNGNDITAWFTCPRETHIYSTKTIYEYATPDIRNKVSKYYHLASGTWCGKRDIMMNHWNKSFSDKELDEMMQTDKSELMAYFVEDWQGFECDYKEWFDINEMIMEKFILKGRGIEIYGN